MKASFTASPGCGKPMGSRGSWELGTGICVKKGWAAVQASHVERTTVPREPAGELSAARGPGRWDQMFAESAALRGAPGGDWPLQCSLLFTEPVTVCWAFCDLRPSSCSLCSKI